MKDIDGEEVQPAAYAVTEDRQGPEQFRAIQSATSEYERDVYEVLAGYPGQWVGVNVIAREAGLNPELVAQCITTLLNRGLVE